MHFEQLEPRTVFDGAADSVAFASLPSSEEIAAADFVSRGDFDGDNDLDVLAARFISIPEGLVEITEYRYGIDGLQVHRVVEVDIGGVEPDIEFLFGSAITHADFDGDEFLDFALSTRVGVHPFRGDANGYVSLPTLFTDGKVRQIEVADLNGDLIDDVIVRSRVIAAPTSPVGTTISTYVNAGDGTFTHGSDHFYTRSIESAFASGDIDEDGDIDLVVSRDEGTIVSDTVTHFFLENEGDGILIASNESSISTGGWPNASLIRDFTGDGIQDFVVAYETGTRQAELELYRGSSDGFDFANPTVRFVPLGSVTELVSGDLNGDQLPDIAFIHGKPDLFGSDPGVAVMLNGGEEGLSQAINALTIPTSLKSAGLLICDTNNDGRADLSFVDLSDATRLTDISQLAPEFRIADFDDGIPSALIAFDAATFVDLNHDGWLDFVGAGFWNEGLQNSVVIRYGIADGEFGPGQHVAISTNVFRLALRDIDENGIDDIVVLPQEGDASLIAINEEGVAQPAVMGPFADQPIYTPPAAIIADVGREVFVTSVDNTRLSIQVGVNELTRHDAVTGDLDNDGHGGDYLVAHSLGFVLALALPSVLEGDIDNDGKVAFSDFLILAANFEKEDAIREEGDLDNNKIVQFADFLILSQNFGRTV